MGISAVLGSSALLLTVSYDASIIVACFGAFLVGLLFRPQYLRGWIPAISVMLIWIVSSGDMYRGYNTFRLTLFGISIFPMLAWPAGLIVGYYYIVPLVKSKSWLRRWFILSIIYAVGMITFETIGYNVLHIHLDAGKPYPGWPILNILHCPPWMQVVYFANGIIFMGVVSWMDKDKAMESRIQFVRRTWGPLEDFIHARLARRYPKNGVETD